jgi:8-oxo-dGTP pyrophosphatase MutT (NUDIX family)
MSLSSSAPARWEKLGHTSLAQTRIFELQSARFRHPVRGTERDFVTIASPDWVNVLALTPDHQLVLVRQFRFGTEEFSLELPGGIIDLGEEPVAAGLRELREETGFAGADARVIGRVHPNPAIQRNRCHFVLLERARPATPTDWDPDEEIEVLTRPVEEVFALAHSGGITHALVLNALLFFEAYWRERQPR